MNILKICAVLLLASLMVGGKCQHTNTVILTEGPKAAELGKQKDEQIQGLVKQVKAEQDSRLMAQALASKAASSVKGMLKVRDYLPEGLPSDAIKTEGELALTRLPPDDPAETVKALERVVLIVTGQRDEAEKKYQEANAQTLLERAEKEAKDAEIVKIRGEIEKREGIIAKLEQKKKDEQLKHAEDVKKAFAVKNAEIQKIKDENAAKERKWWINTTRIAGLGLIVAGAVALAVFKMVGVGGGLVGAGVLIGLISMGIEALTAQWWFPYLCGAVFLVVIGLGCYGIYKAWVKHQLNDKKTQAIQDMIDEATIKGDTKTISELKAHLKYRLGDKTSFFGKAQAAEVAQLGLVDVNGEKAIAAQKVAEKDQKS